MGSQLKTESRVNPRKWKKQSLSDLMESHGENWRIPDESIIICVWPKGVCHKTQPPDGFVAFSLNANKEEDYPCFSITLDLVWVIPKRRSLGGVFAHHVAAHLCHYLSGIDYAKKNKYGADELILYADFYGLGAEGFFNIIAEYLEAEINDGSIPFESLSTDAGW